MKKGLRRYDTYVPVPGMISNRRPDEEGIKTVVAFVVVQNEISNRRPDEEGIKTPEPLPTRSA